MAAPGKTTILVVDDEASLVETLGEILLWEGYRVRTAANGRLGLEEMERELPSLLLIDFMMPVMDGIQVLDVMRKSEKLRHVPVILMTAAHMALPRQQRLYQALLRKPFEVDAVLKLVRNLLEESDGASRA